MKTLGIIGIVVSSLWILIGLFDLSAPGVWLVVLSFGYFLALSIKSLEA